MARTGKQRSSLVLVKRVPLPQRLRLTTSSRWDLDRVHGKGWGHTPYVCLSLCVRLCARAAILEKHNLID